MAAKENLNSFLFTLFGFGKARSKAHIALIVLIHTAGWCIFFLLPLVFYPGVQISGSRFFVREFADKLFLVGFFYFNYYFLIPRFFERKKVLAYCLLVFGCYSIYLAGNLFLRNQYRFLNQVAPKVVHFRTRNPRLLDSLPPPILRIKRRGEGMSPDSTDVFLPAIRESFFMGVPRGIVFLWLNNTLSSFSLLLLMGGFIRLSFSFIRNQNEKKMMENANLNAEVSFLKSQINPHFLFNTLNGIYSLANARSPHTEQAILELSQMLRYVLYDSSTAKIELNKDIAYISNYMHLQRLRLARKVRIHYEVRGNTEGLFIAPLLLITFIENAFKHGVSYLHPSTISVEIVVFEETLTLIVSNTVFEYNKFDSGGIGLKNARRRLELMYPGKYLLDIVTHERLYVVNLKINLLSD